MARISKAEKARRERLQSLGAVAADMEGFAQGREVLTPVRSVQTVFPQFDVATRVNGYPIQRVCMVHGPSNQGKTFFTLGLGRSFLMAEHFYYHIDAEFSTPEPWVVENLREFADYPTFLAIRPRNYEEVADMIRKACDRLVKARKAGKIPEHTSALFAVDSSQRLVPKDFLTKMRQTEAKGGGGIDPMSGRGGQVQASFHAAWMKELVPLMYHANAGLVLISRESENVGGGMFEKTYKVGGGTAPYYDSSIVARITRAPLKDGGWVKRGEEIIGEKHLIQIVKTKVGHKDDKTTRCYFHTSNGVHIPAGFDFARDVVDLGLKCGVLEKDSGHKILDSGTGEEYGAMNDAVKLLTDNYATLADLRTRVVMHAQPEVE